MIPILNKMKKRNTRQKEIIEDVIKNQNHFFTAEEIHQITEKENISLATIYRFLKEKKEKLELYAYSCNKKQVYSKNKKSHCHYICEETGEVIHFDIDSLDFLKDKIPGEINSFHIEVRGTCKKCK